MISLILGRNKDRTYGFTGFTGLGLIWEFPGFFQSGNYNLIKTGLELINSGLKKCVNFNQINQNQ